MEQLLRLLVTESFSRDLNPAQWAALRYLSRANESARQIGAFATFRRTTPSSASQTISALVKKGMIVKSRGQDGRSRTLDLTKEGADMLAHDPIMLLSDAIESLPSEKRQLLAETMQLLLSRMISER